LIALPLNTLLADCENTRYCPLLPDHEWLETGVSGVLSEPSGRSFLQKRFDVGLNLSTQCALP
jgi:hypothetical protein